MVDWFERFSIKSADLLLLLSKEIWEELELWFSFVLVNCSALFTAILKHSNREDLKILLRKGLSYEDSLPKQQTLSLHRWYLNLWLLG